MNEGVTQHKRLRRPPPVRRIFLKPTRTVPPRHVSTTLTCPPYTNLACDAADSECENRTSCSSHGKAAKEYDSHAALAVAVKERRVARQLRRNNLPSSTLVTVTSGLSGYNQSNDVQNRAKVVEMNEKKLLAYTRRHLDRGIMLKADSNFSTPLETRVNMILHRNLYFDPGINFNIQISEMPEEYALENGPLFGMFYIVHKLHKVLQKCNAFDRISTVRKTLIACVQQADSYLSEMFLKENMQATYLNVASELRNIVDELLRCEFSLNLKPAQRCGVSEFKQLDRLLIRIHMHSFDVKLNIYNPTGPTAAEWTLYTPTAASNTVAPRLLHLPLRVHLLQLCDELHSHPCMKVMTKEYICAHVRMKPERKACALRIWPDYPQDVLCHTMITHYLSYTDLTEYDVEHIITFLTNIATAHRQYFCEVSDFLSVSYLEICECFLLKGYADEQVSHTARITVPSKMHLMRRLLIATRQRDEEVQFIDTTIHDMQELAKTRPDVSCALQEWFERIFRIYGDTCLKDPRLGVWECLEDDTNLSGEVLTRTLDVNRLSLYGPETNGLSDSVADTFAVFQQLPGVNIALPPRPQSAAEANKQSAAERAKRASLTLVYTEEVCNNAYADGTTVHTATSVSSDPSQRTPSPSDIFGSDSDEGY